MKNELCSKLGIDFPLFAFTHCRDVVAEVTNAGGFGVLGAVGLTPETLEIQLNWIDEKVKGKPYGVDLLIPQRMEGREEQISDAELREHSLPVPEATEAQSSSSLRPMRPRWQLPSSEQIESAVPFRIAASSSQSRAPPGCGLSPVSVQDFTQPLSVAADGVAQYPVSRELFGGRYFLLLLATSSYSSPPAA